MIDILNVSFDKNERRMKKMSDICICEDDTMDFINFKINLGVVGNINTNAWISLDHPKAKDKLHPAIAVGTSIDDTEDCESIYECTKYIDINFCPFCGRKLV